MTEEKTLVTKGKTMVTKWLTLALNGRNMMTAWMTLMTKGKTLVTKGRTLATMPQIERKQVGQSAKPMQLPAGPSEKLPIDRFFSSLVTVNCK